MGGAEWRVGPDGMLGWALRSCLQAAVAAPSVHNSQPWRFRVVGHTVDVFADFSRRLSAVDPAGRELYISVGAAVFNLRISMLALGRVPVLQLLPAPDRPDLAARITPGPAGPAPEFSRRLASVVPLRRTNRQPFTDTLVPTTVLNELADAATAERGTLVMVDRAVRDSVLGLVRVAEQRWREDPAYWAELETWTRQGAQDRTDGVPPQAYGPWSALEHVPVRDFGLIQPAPRWVVPFEAEPSIAVLYTPDDTPLAWLRAGQALQRVLLAATLHGVATTLMTQPLEIPELRERLATPDGMRPQALIRLGYGPPIPATPRRPLRDVVDGLVPIPPR